MEERSVSQEHRHQSNRRRLIKAAGAATASAGLELLGAPAFAQGARRIKLGYVAPITGPLASFGEPCRYVVDQMQARFKTISIAGRSVPVEIVLKDSQSNSNRAAEVAAELILKDRIDLMLVSSTPDTTNPVADQCEVNEMPCISTDCPWQPWFFGRGGKPEVGFKWAYHFFWGLEDVIEVFTNMWNSVQTNKVVAGMFPNDADGNAWGDPKLGLPPALARQGFKLIDPGRYQVLTNDFSAQIAAFKKANCEIVTGNMIPPDFKTFWTQARQQGYRPKVVSIGKALLFAPAIEALGDLGDGLTSEVWWGPTHPFKSSLTGQSAGQLVSAYESATKRQWAQSLGFSHALFEVAADVLKRARSIDDKPGLRDAIAATKLSTIVGPVAWTGKPVKNISKTPLVGGQWVKGKRYKYELLVVNNKTAPGVPLGGKMKLLS
ncbi:MAG: ABC transporter substrate-binding protein [Burkholderiales bacterium]|nr:ABC transporter substrate-binding protein [Burkholderiales bacterium]